MNHQTNNQMAPQDALDTLLDVMGMHIAFDLPLVPTSEELAA